MSLGEHRFHSGLIRLALCSPVISVLSAEDCNKLKAEADKAFQTQQFPAAAESMAKAVKACRDKMPLLLSLGQIQYLLGREEDSEASLRQAIGINPKHVPALYALGRIYYQQYRYNEALELLRNAVKLEPENYRAHDNLALCYDALHRDSDALRHFFRALDIVMKKHPDYDWAHANLADFFLKRNENEKAFQLAAEAATRNPQSARNAFLAGKALVKLEKFDLSLRWLEQAARLDPDHAEAWYHLAQVYRKIDRPADATNALGRFKEAGAKQKPRR